MPRLSRPRQPGSALPRRRRPHAHVDPGLARRPAPSTPDRAPGPRPAPAAEPARTRPKSEAGKVVHEPSGRALPRGRRGGASLTLGLAPAPPRGLRGRSCSALAGSGAGQRAGNGIPVDWMAQGEESGLRSRQTRFRHILQLEDSPTPELKLQKGDGPGSRASPSTQPIPALANRA